PGGDTSQAKARRGPRAEVPEGGSGRVAAWAAVRRHREAGRRQGASAAAGVADAQAPCAPRGPASSQKFLLHHLEKRPRPSLTLTPRNRLVGPRSAAALSLGGAPTPEDELSRRTPRTAPCPDGKVTSPRWPGNSARDPPTASSPPGGVPGRRYGPPRIPPTAP